MQRLLDEVARHLELSKNQNRRFLVSVSGGPDSSLLLFLMSRLSKVYGFELSAIHFNFHLRGPDSNRDETYARRLAKKCGVALRVESLFLKKKTAVQESARSERLKKLETIDSAIEILEAHHADDQVETFFLRLLRGSNLKGLSGISSPKQRGRHRIWRPFLAYSKSEILHACKEAKLRPRTDRSNKKTDYDRNFLRLKILKPLFKRFPSGRSLILKTIEDFRERDLSIQNSFQEAMPQILVSEKPLRLSREGLLRLSSLAQRDFLNRLFRERLAISLSRQKTTELHSLLHSRTDFTFNAPQGYLVRCRKERLWVEKAPQKRGVTKAESALYSRKEVFDEPRI